MASIPFPSALTTRAAFSPFPGDRSSISSSRCLRLRSTSNLNLFFCIMGPLRPPYWPPRVKNAASEREIEDPISDEGVLGEGCSSKAFLDKVLLREAVQEGFHCSINSSGYDASTIASSIKYHAKLTPSFSPGNFALPKAYFATADSVRDALILNWNTTNDYYDKLNMKQAYYLSMEFLQVG
ncbi:Alpha-1,4 glucan phosphorylase L isozyme, chloroplastic/amyloplastic [Apostasia shenzhenica]|uniref:Alpha-1,4 glucan phosphorylase L isozyme, chloroplastic/amyloplastic n=1 Tax=Apostasia shenzhenica TaxID=1088818 RepID=A0A2I0BDN2_9ASPA|nr:Alpha-1,4 glucan phosphorylase L isozyme, chloroplastic/amyloplastic [Apostasia shenzhenica]